MTLCELIADFNNFGDGLLESFRFDWDSNNNQERFLFSINARSNSSGDRKVNLIINGVQQFKITHHRDKLNYQVLSNGLHIVKIGDLWTIEFGTFADPSKTLEEVSESDFYVIGTSINIEVEE